MERVDYESMVIQELLNTYDRGELNISPWYQRRAVWTNAHKSYLVNSIFSTTESRQYDWAGIARRFASLYEELLASAPRQQVARGPRA